MQCPQIQRYSLLADIIRDMKVDEERYRTCSTYRELTWKMHRETKEREDERHSLGGRVDST